MTTPTSVTPFPQLRNTGDGGSFFATQQTNPTTNPLIVEQVDPTAPSITGLSKISDPIQPSANAQDYVKNFDPNLYDLRDTSHLMRLIKALCGAPGIGGIRKQTLIARLASLLASGSFLDLDKFYGAIFGLQRHTVEALPQNLDGTTVNPYTDLATSDIWDDAISRDARYRSRIYQLARAVNMGATYPGLRGAAEAVINADVDLVESWVKVDLLASQPSIEPPFGNTYRSISNQYVTYGNIDTSYAYLSGIEFGAGQLPFGNRGELIFTPSRSISEEERYQLAHVLNTLKPSNTQVTIARQVVEASVNIKPRALSADSEDWLIQSRVTPALNLVNPPTPLYQNAGPYSQARPVYSEYVGESWTYNPNMVRAVSYTIDVDTQSSIKDDQVITYSDQTQHTYRASDGVRDVRQAISQRLSGEGPVTIMPYQEERANFATPGGFIV